MEQGARKNKTQPLRKQHYNTHTHTHVMNPTNSVIVAVESQEQGDCVCVASLPAVNC